MRVHAVPVAGGAQAAAAAAAAGALQQTQSQARSAPGAGAVAAAPVKSKEAPVAAADSGAKKRAGSVASSAAVDHTMSDAEYAARLGAEAQQQLDEQVRQQQSQLHKDAAAADAATAALIAALAAEDDQFERDMALARSLKEETFDCPYCLEEVPMADVHTPECCGTQICRYCQRQNFLTELEEQRMPACMCRQAISETTLRLFLTADEFVRYQKLSLHSATKSDLNADEKWLSCATPDCDVRVIGTKDTTQWQCQGCAQQWCAGCQSKWHADQTCAQFRTSAEFAREQQIAKENIGHNTQHNNDTVTDDAHAPIS